MLTRGVSEVTTYGGIDRCSRPIWQSIPFSPRYLNDVSSRSSFLTVLQLSRCHHANRRTTPDVCSTSTSCSVRRTLADKFLCEFAARATSKTAIDTCRPFAHGCPVKQCFSLVGFQLMVRRTLVVYIKNKRLSCRGETARCSVLFENFRH